MFDWDDANISHIAIHGISPAEAEQVIANHPFNLGRQLRNGEERMLHVGETTDGRILVVVTTPRGELIRIVTAFPADKEMRKFYAAQKDATHDKDPKDS